MAEWTTPKTDWHSDDYFNAVDFNRIKNNLQFLRDFAVLSIRYDEFEIGTVSDDKVVGDYFYADEINQMEKNLVTINERTISYSYGDSQSYNENGNIMDYIELNRLESAILDLYNRLYNQYEGRRMFIWNFGMGGGF